MSETRPGTGKAPSTPPSKQAPSTPPPATAKPPSAYLKWGLDGDQVYEKLQGKTVMIRMADGIELVGRLVGYSQFTITLKAPDGVKVINKGAMAWLEPGKVTPPAAVEPSEG